LVVLIEQRLGDCQIKLFEAAVHRDDGAVALMVAAHHGLVVDRGVS
jgi:hypothetical protein